MVRTDQNIGGDVSEVIGDELPPGSKLCGGQYKILKFLNSGGFGITYLAHDSLGRKLVIKECFPGAMCFRENQTVRLRSRDNGADFERILDLFRKEALALSELDHAHIVGVHQIFQDNGTAYMALDFIEGQDLGQIIESDLDRLSPDDIHQILLKLLGVVAYIHERGILHRDISPDNILIEADNSPVLIDFGAARADASAVSRVLSKVITVKDGYSPQEFYLAGSAHEFSSDLYALAATFHHVVSGKPPVPSQIRLSAVAKNQPDPLVPLGAECSGYAQDFLKAINVCLSVFPSERLANAREWLDMIDVERRQQVLKHRAASDQQLAINIARLVSASAEESLSALAPEIRLAPKMQVDEVSSTHVPVKLTLDELIAFEESCDALVETRHFGPHSSLSLLELLERAAASPKPHTPSVRSLESQTDQAGWLHRFMSRVFWAGQEAYE